ncbi:MAG: hypothetical protein HQ583_10665 [Candidatus Abyssubacteria bacterium]|nr:hypothetical protein [Candidatus Abyssubacteria bacterium]
MKEFEYEGVDKNGRTVRGSTTAESVREVKAQLVEFGFTNIRVEEKGVAPAPMDQAGDDYIQRPVDGDIEETPPEEEVEEDEWRRLEVLERVRRYRRKENIALAIILVVLGFLAAYFIYDKITEIPAPQPTIVTQSSSEMLTFKDVYIRGRDLVFIVFSPNWNGNVRVDFKAWDPFGKEIDHGTARLGFIGEYYGATPEKSGTFKLKKTRFYEKIEIVVSGDEEK